MGMEVPAAVVGEEETTTALSGRPSIVIVGPRNVGKRSILNRMYYDSSMNFTARYCSSASIVCYA